jgi:hypothetical protein
VNTADVGVLQVGDRLRLDFKACAFLGADSRREKLERNGAFELRVLGLVHDAHSTAANFLSNRIMENRFADHITPNGTGLSPPGCTPRVDGRPM